MATPRAVLAAASGQRPYQVVVWGASGFTGRLVCEHLAQQYSGRVQWAMAGRNPAKLEMVRSEIAEMYPDVADVNILTADLSKPETLDNLLEQTKVVISTAGPFSLLGEPLVEGCLRSRTHYCDITGETPFVRKMIDAHHASAQEKQVKIVNMCGYDSIPSDLGVLYTVDWIRKNLGKPTSDVEMLVGESLGGFSGGTLASALVVMDTASKIEGFSDPHYLNPAGPRSNKNETDSLMPGSAKLSNASTMFWVMAGVNERVVRRTYGLTNGVYGPDFTYAEKMRVGGAIAAWLGTLVLGLGIGLLMTPLRGLLMRWLPAQGEGPDEKTRRQGFWNHYIHARTSEEPGVEPTKVVAKMSDPNGDPGYWSTSRMVLEAGLCLALEEERLNEAGLPSGGCLTPAAAMGHVLIARLKERGLTFEILEPKSD